MTNDFEKIQQTVRQLSMMIFEFSEKLKNRKTSTRRLLSFPLLPPDEQESAAINALREFKDSAVPFPPMRNIEDSQQNIFDNIDGEKGIVNFTEKEINTMPKNLRKLIIIQKKRCRLRLHKSGKNTSTYEIRFRCDGYDISACGKTLELAKENFIKKLKTAKPKHETSSTVPTTFDEFSKYYFETFRKEKVSKATFNTDLNRYKKHLQPHFKQTPLKRILPSDCKSLLDNIKSQGLGKTADELYSLMNIIFKSAIAHGLLDRNPLDIVMHTQHETESGTALSKQEEILLKESSAQYAPWFMLMLYTGIRPNEFDSVKIEGKFIIAINSKRKNKKIHYKRIPIMNGLKKFLPLPEYKPPVRTLREKIKDILPNHILYDLRTTFHSRCIEYKVDDIARKLFMGHSLGKLTQAYTDLSDEYFLNEAKKMDEW